MSGQKLRVLLLADSRSFHIERLVAQLRRQNCRVLLASLEHGVMHHFHLKPISSLRPLNYFLLNRQIKVIASRFRPNVIYAHFATGYGYAAARAVRGLKIPMVLNTWGSDILMAGERLTFRRHKARLALRRASYVFADSGYLLKEAGKLCFIASGEVIPWGIEKEFLALHRTDYNLGTPLKIIVPRAHEPVYANEFIVRALAGLIEEDRIRITFPEFGSQAESFRHHANAMVGDKIEYYPRLTRPEFMALMAQHDVYLSNSQSDSSPVSLIEAMALGLIPVAADIPGVREWLSPETGFSYPVGNAGALQVLITSLVDSPGTYADLRQRNLDRVKGEAIFEDNVARQVDVMRTVAEGAGS